MLSRGDVLDMKPEVESTLRQATILAARLRTAGNKSASRDVQPFASRSVDLSSQRLDDAEHVGLLNQILVLRSLNLSQRPCDCLCGECIDAGLDTRGDLNRQNPRRDFGRQAFGDASKDLVWLRRIESCGAHIRGLYPDRQHVRISKLPYSTGSLRG